MATNAIIWIKNSDGTFKGASVHFDGYINHGVGEILYNHYCNNFKTYPLAKKLINGGEIRTLETTPEDSEYYHKGRGVIHAKNWNELNEISKDYSYSYYFKTAPYPGLTFKSHETNGSWERVVCWLNSAN